jgi:hypothetical protein
VSLETAVDRSEKIMIVWTRQRLCNRHAHL